MSEFVGLRELDAAELEHIEGGFCQTFDYIFAVFTRNYRGPIVLPPPVSF
jgi:hypothetical protein